MCVAMVAEMLTVAASLLLEAVVVLLMKNKEIKRNVARYASMWWIFVDIKTICLVYAFIKVLTTVG